MLVERHKERQTKTMARREITSKLYNDLVRSFRERPGVFSYTARMARVTNRTAKKAWEKGWPEKGFGPIKDIVEEEQTVISARVQIEREAKKATMKMEAVEEMKLKLDHETELEASRRHAVETRIEEAKMIGASRKIIIKNLEAIQEYSEPLQLAGGRLAIAIRDAALDDEHPIVFGEKTFNQLSRALRGLGMTMRDLLTAAKTAMEMERLYHGEAQKIIGITSDIDQLSTEELMQEIEDADSAITRAKDRGLIVHEGGKTA